MIFQLMECVCRYISKTVETIHFSMTLFTVFITYEYTNEMCMSVYSINHESCSLLNNTIHDVHYI
jgi:hypothetical protein